MRANVIRSRFFIRPAMFDLGLEWTVGLGGGGRARRPWLVARNCISGNEQVKLKLIKLKTGSSLFRQKQTHVEPISETVRQFFSSQKRNGLDKSSSAITNMNRCLLHSIFSKQNP